MNAMINSISSRMVGERVLLGGFGWRTEVFFFSDIFFSNNHLCFKREKRRGCPLLFGLLFMFLPAALLHALFTGDTADFNTYHRLTEIFGDFGQHLGIIEVSGGGHDSPSALHGITGFKDS